MVLANFPFGKEILTQVNHRDALMMRVFDEQVQHALVVTSFVHQIVQNQDTSFGKPTRKCFAVQDSFVELDPSLFELFKAFLPRPVAIMNGFRRYGKQVCIVQKQMGREHGLATPLSTDWRVCEFETPCVVP